MDVCSCQRNNLLWKSHQRWLSQVNLPTLHYSFFSNCFFIINFLDEYDLNLIRLYQYIHGANLNTSEITMTAPVLTSIVPSMHGPAEYYVRLYLPAKYERTPPQPSSDLNLQFDKWRSHCIAVRKFTGFAKDDHFHKEFETLVNSLNKHLNGKPAILEDKSSYAIAQYNASYHLSWRLNEVWMDLSGFTSDCWETHRHACWSGYFIISRSN